MKKILIFETPGQKAQSVFFPKCQNYSHNALVFWVSYRLDEGYKPTAWNKVQIKTKSKCFSDDLSWPPHLFSTVSVEVGLRDDGEMMTGLQRATRSLFTTCSVCLCSPRFCYQMTRPRREARANKNRREKLLLGLSSHLISRKWKITKKMFLIFWNRAYVDFNQQQTHWHEAACVLQVDGVI